MRNVGTLEHQASSRKMLSNQSSNDSVEMQKRCGLSEKWIAVLFTVVASLGYVSVGTMVAWSSNGFARLQLGAEVQPRLVLEEVSEQELSPNQMTSLAATPALLAAICTILVYKVYYRVGTKLFMLTAATLMIAANFLLTFGNCFWYFSAGRVLAGISAGIIFTLTQPYVDELGSKQYKALLDGILYVQFAFGILIQLMSDLLPFTELSSLISSAIPIFLFIGFLFLPESARYLCAVRQTNQARAILKKTHTNDALAVQIMENNLAYWARTSSIAVPLLRTIRELSNSRIVVPLLALVVFQQFAGAIPMIFYLTRILSLTDGQYTPEWTAIYIAAIFTISIPVYRLCSIRIGSYKLLLWSCFMMAAAMAGLGWHCHVQGIKGHSDEYGHIPLVCFGIFVALYAISFQQTPWKWLEENLEEDNFMPVRAIACSLSWASMYVCVRLVPTLITFIGVGWLFWNVAIVLLFAALFVLLTLPNLDKSGIPNKTLAECSGSSSASSATNIPAALEDVV